MLSVCSAYIVAPCNDGGGAAVMLSVCSKHASLVGSCFKMDYE